MGLNTFLRVFIAGLFVQKGVALSALEAKVAIREDHRSCGRHVCVVVVVVWVMGGFWCFLSVKMGKETDRQIERERERERERDENSPINVQT